MKPLQTIITFSAVLLTFSSMVLADTGDANLALNQPATASGMYDVFIPSNAFDGDEETYWNAGGYGGHWIEVDLGSDTIIGAIRLMVAQNPNGGTTHVITGRSEAGDTVSLTGFSEYTVNFQWLEDFEINNPVAVRYVRITTTNTPSWVAWAEVEVYEGGVVAIEEANWSSIKALYR